MGKVDFNRNGDAGGFSAGINMGDTVTFGTANSILFVDALDLEDSVNLEYFDPTGGSEKGLLVGRGGQSISTQHRLFLQDPLSQTRLKMFHPSDPNIVLQLLTGGTQQMSTWLGTAETADLIFVQEKDYSVILSFRSHSGNGNYTVASYNGVNTQKIFNCQATTSGVAIGRDYADNHQSATANGIIIEGGVAIGDTLDVNNDVQVKTSDATPETFDFRVRDASAIGLARINNKGGIAFGFESMVIQNSEPSIALGFKTLQAESASVESGGLNIAIGSQALMSGGGANLTVCIGIGKDAGLNMADEGIGSNICIGAECGDELGGIGSEADDNLLIGFETGENLTTDESTNIIIGSRVKGITGADNQLNIGNTLRGSYLSTTSESGKVLMKCKTTTSALALRNNEACFFNDGSFKVAYKDDSGSIITFTLS